MIRFCWVRTGPQQARPLNLAEVVPQAVQSGSQDGSDSTWADSLSSGSPCWLNQAIACRVTGSALVLLRFNVEGVSELLQ